MTWTICGNPHPCTKMTPRPQPQYPSLPLSTLWDRLFIQLCHILCKTNLVVPRSFYFFSAASIELFCFNRNITPPRTQNVCHAERKHKTWTQKHASTRKQTALTCRGTTTMVLDQNESQILIQIHQSTTAVDELCLLVDI